MKQAVIDVGSNSIHLTVYEIHKNVFKTLFRSKIMVGLAGYVENGSLSRAGIEAAVDALTEFRLVLRSLSIDRIAVFATASLRNIDNTTEAVKALRKATGFSIEVISGDEEALLSYQGAMMDLKLRDGAFVDIGGASTELISFEGGRVVDTDSCRFGSLSLYKKCVGRILPGSRSAERMGQIVDEALAGIRSRPSGPRTPLVCVGGTARTVLKLARMQFGLPESCRSVTAAQVETLLNLLLCQDKKAVRMLLRLAPDRIHTLIPGLFILDRIVHLYGSEEIIVSRYGIREGFLCRKIIQS